MACRWLSSWQQLLERLLLVLEESAPAGVEIVRCKHKGSAFLQLITHHVCDKHVVGRR